MKKAFAMPKIVVEQFVPNEYVAACGDSGTMYKFTCDSGQDYINFFGISIDAWGDVYLDNGTNLTPGRRNYYHPCGKTHEVPTDTDFEYGYFYLNAGTDIILDSTSKVRVIIWTENGTNVHCSTNLEKEDWETTKS